MSSATNPVRYPELGSPDVMTKRAWWLVVLNILIPGSAQLLAGNRKLGRFGVGATFILWALAIIALVAFLFAQGAFITFATNFWVLWVLQAVLVFYLVLWIVLTLDTLRLIKLVRVGSSARAFVAGLAVVAMVGIGGTAAYGVMIAGVTRSTLGEVFAGGTIEPPVDGRYNILLLGGDGGADRDGLRPDSISVASVDAVTGEAVMIGVPRNLEGAIFNPESPMAALYPDGYYGCDVDVCLINSIYTEVELYHSDLYPDAAAAGSSPGIEAMRDVVEGTLGISIQYYVLVDMQGFIDLIDALGGIVIDSPQRYPITDEVDENGDPYEEVQWIEAGVQTMDGYTALSYARIRAGTTDYDRMQRQRQVQEAVIEQFEPANVLSKFQAIAEAGTRVVRTDIPQGMLGPFVELAGKTRQIPISSIELVPPLVDPEYPDFEYIHQLVDEALVVDDPESED